MLGIHPFGIYEKALTPTDSWQTRLETVRSLGFDFLEICIDEKDDRIDRLYNSNKRAKIIGASLHTGIPIPSMCLSAHRRFSFGSADSERRDIAWDIMVRAIEFADELGVSIIQIAAYDVYYEPSTKESRARFIDTLGKAVDLASKYKITLANEIMDTPFMNSITKHLTLEKEIHNPWLKVYPDLGNLTAWGNDVVSELNKGRNHIAQVHLKDTLPVTDSFPGKFRDVSFGSGCVDFPLCFETLNQIGYKGSYLLEMWHHNDDNGTQRVEESKRYIERKFAAAKGVVPK